MNGPDTDSILIIRIIMFILLVLTSFIYNELLVINICGLGNYTKLFLDYKAKIEAKYRIESEMSVDLSNDIVDKNKM